METKEKEEIIRLVEKLFCALHTELKCDQLSEKELFNLYEDADWLRTILQCLARGMTIDEYLEQ